MNRRDFGRIAGLSAVGALGHNLKNGMGEPLSTAEQTPKEKRALMKVGCQSIPMTVKGMQFAKRYGVDNICAYPKMTPDRRWEVNELKTLKELCESQGVSLDLMPLPLESNNVKDKVFPNIFLGKSPERDREIDLINDMIRASAQAEIFCLKYNLSMLEVLRTESTPGRGGSTYSTWVYEKAPKNLPLTIAGPVPAEVFWERITYFLERIIPVATEYKVRMACHPHDPGVPPSGYRGVDRVLGTIDGLKHFIEISPGPYHGLNLCLGTVAENLQDPANEIFDVIRHFGTRKKIFNIHFRNIKGKRDNFQEVYPDEGDVNMYKVMKTLKEVEYPYLCMPDHIPHHPDDPDGRQAFAFCYGYIKALIQAVDETV